MKKNLHQLIKILAFVFLVGITVGSNAQVQFTVQGSANVNSIETGAQFIYTLNYQLSSLNQNGQNVVATIDLPQNLEPFDVNNFSNSINFNNTQVANASYSAGNNRVTITYVNPLPAGSTGQLQIRFRYRNGVTPNGYAPSIVTSIDADNNVNADNSTGPVLSNATIVTAIASLKHNITKTRHAGGAPNDITIYRLALSVPSSSTTGQLDLVDFVVIDTLPVGAVFVAATAFPGSNQPIYNASNRTITWLWPGNISGGNAHISVRYNSPTFQVGTNVCNVANLSGFVPALPIGTTEKSSKRSEVCFALQATNASLICTGAGITAATASWLSRHVLPATSGNTFRQGWANNGNTELDSVQVNYSVDRAVDMNVIRVNPVFDGFDSLAPNPVIVVQYKTNTQVNFITAGTFTSQFLQNNSGARNVTVNLPAGQYITDVRITTRGPLPIGSRQDLSYSGRIRTVTEGKKDGTPIVEGTTYLTNNPGDDGTLVANASTGTFFYNGVATNFSTCTSTSEILKPYPSFNTASKSRNPSSPSDFRASDTVGYRFSVQLGGTINAENVIVTDTLDNRLEYVPGSATFYSVSPNGPVTSIEPTIQGNVLTFSLGTLVPGRTFRIDFRTVIKPGTPAGSINNRMRLESSNGIQQNILTSNVPVTVISSVALRARKGQSGCDSNFVYFPDFAVAQEGGPVNYKVTVSNLGNVASKDLVLVDVFPFIGDNRGSQWFANLVGPVSISDPHTTVFYTTTNNPCINDVTPAVNAAGCTTPVWTSVPPVDITTVKAIKLSRTVPLGILDSIEFTWPMRAPLGTPVGLRMNNSITYQVSRADNNSQLLPATPNMVGMFTNCNPVLGSLGNYVWIDVNKNGLQDEAPSLGLNGVKVYLYGAGPDNAIGGNDDILLDSTVTANDFSGRPGYYKFVELPSGKYYVQFPTSYAHYLPTPVVNQAPQTDENSDMNVTTGRSGLVTINAAGTGQDKHNTTIDAGYYPIGSLGNYVWRDDNADGIQNEPVSNGINQVKVVLFKQNGSNQFVAVDSLFTANDNQGRPGYYNFIITESGNYQVRFPVSVDGRVITKRTITAGTDNNSDADSLTGFSPVIVMNLLQNGIPRVNPTIDAGYICNIAAPSVLGDTTICAGNTTTLTAPSGFSQYQWYKNNVLLQDSTRRFLVVDTTGSFTVKVTADNGCNRTSLSPFVVTQLPNPTCGFTSNADTLEFPGHRFVFKPIAPQAGFTYSWKASDTSNAVIAFDSLVVVYGAPGPYKVSLTITSPAGCVTVCEREVFVTQGVSGGSGGGIESYSLGEVIGKRNMAKAKAGQLGETNYGATPKWNGPVAETNRNGIASENTTQIRLRDVMPNGLQGYQAFVTSPTDLTQFTNAVEVMSVDFTKGNVPRAVAFATKTLDEVYNHTKPICDRLRGAQLIGIEKIQLNGIEVLSYRIRQENGSVEFAMSFSAGASSRRSEIQIESKWFTKDIQHDDAMFNFQVWGETPGLTSRLASEILSKLGTYGRLTQGNNNAVVPSAYVVSGQRVGSKLVLSVENGTANSNGYFELEEKLNEKSSVTKRTVPFTIQQRGRSTLELDMRDGFESDVRMFINGELMDLVYMSDGIWGLDFDRSRTTIKNFIVTNDASRVYQDEYPLFRDVKIEGTTSNYITAYKFLRGGGVAADLSAYKTLRFEAAGGHKLKITLVKEGVANWNDQYTYSINLDQAKREYQISLNDFVSSGISGKIKANDVTSVVFSIEVNGANTAVNTTLGKVGFTKVDVDYLRSLEAKEVQLYPNPSNGRFTIQFRSAVEAPLKMRMTDAATGRVVMSRAIQAVQGENQVTVEMGRQENMSSQGLYIVNLDGANGLRYKPAKISIKR
ncbi:MAG: hypothetical protein MH132_10505 [Hydrotalea sp.]|nr:hypothetical protein [Hydrotalea sp.]